jgi:Contractile injection system tube protein
MTVGYADLPRAIRSGLVLVDPLLGAPQRIIVMQFNPDTVTRSLAPQATTGESGDRSEALRLVGPAVETWKFEADIDATDQFDTPSPNGIHPQLALLELLIHPPTDRLRLNQALAAAGTIEIAPVETPLTLWVWGAKRVLPVRLTELGITETMFDPGLNPIRATVSVGLRVLNVNDLPTGHRGGELFLAHLAQKEQLAGAAAPAQLGSLGLTGL